MSTDTLLDDILLSSVEGIGSRTYQRLIERFGSSTAVLGASRSDLGGYEFLKSDTLERLLSAKNQFDPTAIVQWCEREKVDIVSWRSERYPTSLKTIHDPPPILYIKGSYQPRDVLSLAVIGTRRVTAYGRRQTERLSLAIARAGFTIISGLAKGVDAIAHQAALRVSGRTLAVLGSGHRSIYPSENEELAAQIVEAGGAVMSEYPPCHPSAKWTFPQRNRIVSGLSLGVLVVEAPQRSGAMITARMAGEQGKDLFAVPGPIDSEFSRGCHQLIRDGACLVDSVDDILEVLGPMTRPLLLPDGEGTMRHPMEMMLNEIELAVLRLTDTRPTSLESIVQASGLTEQQVRAALCVLETKRTVRYLKDDQWVRM